MGLTSKYTLATSRISDLFEKIRDGQAPDQLTQQLLKDWGFTSSTDRHSIPVLKALGFLAPDGKPTALYHEYRDHSRSKIVMAQALRDAYGDIFLIKEHPANADKATIKGKFKSFHNVSDNVANYMTRTFYSLLELSDLKVAMPKKKSTNVSKTEEPEVEKTENNLPLVEKPPIYPPGLHYNIQIHLPATKDIEVYNAIFKSLREHIIEE